jgi:sulfotransferase
MHASIHFRPDPLGFHAAGGPAETNPRFESGMSDPLAGTPGLRTVPGKVYAEPRTTLLPPDLFQRSANDAFWRDPQRVSKSLRIVRG